MKTRSIMALAAFCATTLHLYGADQPSLNPHLEPLRPLLGKTWKGTFKNSKPDKPTVDVSRWERTLNGQAVRMLHSINQGVYGGESIFTWDEAKQAVIYHYFTTAGFRTVGTLEIKEGKFITHETVAGATAGVTEVRGTCEIQPDGRFHVTTEHLANGQWTLGHEVTYEEALTAEVVFR
jgi:hypothetical protein